MYVLQKLPLKVPLFSFLILNSTENYKHLAFFIINLMIIPETVQRILHIHTHIHMYGYIYTHIYVCCIGLTEIEGTPTKIPW